MTRVIGINGAMFLTEMTAGQLAGSQALQADADGLDFLGNTIPYGLSLAVIELRCEQEQRPLY